MAKPDSFFAAILQPILQQYFDADLDKITGDSTDKQRVDDGKVPGVIIEIYTRDHNPPHFHVKSKDGRLNARFTIDNCTLLKGDEIGSSDSKRIYAWWRDIKTEKVLQAIWNRRT